MKQKITSILLLILYFTSNVGYSFSVHYMNGKVVDKQECMTACAMHSGETINAKHLAHTPQEHIEWMNQTNEETDGCSDHDIQIKLKDPQMDSKEEMTSIPFLTSLFVVNYFEFVPLSTENEYSFPGNTVEIISSRVPIYLMHQKLIIYS